jgi:CheY-like chemotaxis protein
LSEASPKRILVVDDEEDVRILVCRILRDLEYDVDSAAEGSEAILKIRERRPDLLILDLMMPGMDGWGVLKALRELPDPPPIVVLTALADYATFTRAVREGAAAYVSKPFRFHELVATCQGVLFAKAAPIPPPLKERRKDQRRAFIVEVKVLSREKHPIALGELIDLSASGARVDVGVPLEAGAPARVAFHVPGGANAFSLLGLIRWRGPSPRGFAHGLSFVGLSYSENHQLLELLRLFS